MPIRLFKNTGDRLRIISVGDTVTKNLTIYEYGDTIIAVDYGIGIPDSDDYGVDFVVPDLTYLLGKRDKFKALFITHAHADHFAAVPYLLKQINVPIYGNRMVQGLLYGLLEEKQHKGLKDNLSYHLLNALADPVTVGPFKVSAFGVNHSVPGSLGLSIETPVGKILHMADYKVDWSPVIDKPIDIATIAQHGKEGVLCLLSDCLGADSPGYISSERTIGPTIMELFEEFEGRQLFITTISSNISRMHQIIEAAIRHGRKVVTAGRSIEQAIEVASGIGYLPFSKDVFVSEKECSRYNQKDLVYIIAGCYGQVGSSLDRLSRKEHDILFLEDGAVVVFSASAAPPGVDVDVERVISNLILQNATVIYDKVRPNLHVSGHGHSGDLSMIASLVRPKYFIPIGGTPIQMRAYKNMVVELGFDPQCVFELGEGGVAEFTSEGGRIGESIQVSDVFIDGTKIDPIVLKDREQLSSDGVFVVVIPVTQRDGKQIVGNTDVVTRGFVYVKESQALMNRSKDIVNKILKGDNLSNWAGIKHKIEKELGKFLYKETSRNPVIIVHSVNF